MNNFFRKINNGKVAHSRELKQTQGKYINNLTCIDYYVK